MLTNLSDLLEMDSFLPDINLTTVQDSEEQPYLHISAKSLKIVTIVFAVVLIPSFSVFGCIGNVLSLVVLVHHKMRNSTNSCLAALAVSDICVLLHSLLFATVTMVTICSPARGRELRNQVYPFFGAYGSIVVARITSLLTTMISIERFIAVYRPIKAKQLCIKKHAHIGIALIYVGTCILFLPLAVKYKISTRISPHSNKTTIILEKTEFGKNQSFYCIYGNIMNVLFRISPLLVILVLNILIVLAIRRTWNARKHLSESYQQNSKYEQTRITKMLLTVSFVFIICILPGAVSSFASKLFPQYSRFGSAKNTFQCVSYVTFFLETVNSSVNFIIYMALSQKFCRTYREVFSCRQCDKGQGMSRDVGTLHVFGKHRHSSSASVFSIPETRITLLRERTSVSSNGSAKRKVAYSRMSTTSDKYTSNSLRSSGNQFCGQSQRDSTT